MTNVYWPVYMINPKGDNRNVQRSIDLLLPNKLELQQAPRDSQCITYYWIWCGCSCRHFSFISSLFTLKVSFPCLSYFPPSPPPFVLSISEMLSPGGKEGVIWSLRALIKTSVWLSGISCADVWVSLSMFHLYCGYMIISLFSCTFSAV